MMNKTKASFLTMISSLINSFLNIVLSFLYTRVLIQTYGSAVNGLIGTLNQFISFFAVLEGGFTTAAVVSLYNPIQKKDYSLISDILYTIHKTLQRIAVFIIVLVLVTGIIFISTINSPFSVTDTYLLLLISLTATILNITVLSEHAIVLQGYNESYYVHLFAIIPKVLFRIIGIILMLHTALPIIVIYSLNITDILFNILILDIYKKKKYGSFGNSRNYNPSLITGTKDIFAQKIAGTIFTSTDLILISSFISLEASSVYHLYTQVFRSVSIILNAALIAPFNSFGQIMQNEQTIENGRILFIYFKKTSVLLTTISLSTVGSITMPFLKIYTNGISDANYLSLSLLVIFYSSIFSQMVNTPYGLILNTTGNFKLQNLQCITAALLNLVLSLALVHPLGLQGIILGSFIGYVIILAANIYQTYNKIFINRNHKDFLILLLNYLFGMLLILLSSKTFDFSQSYYLLIFWGLIIMLIYSCLIISLNILIDKNETIQSIQFVITSIKTKLMSRHTD